MKDYSDLIKQIDAAIKKNNGTGFTAARKIIQLSLRQAIVSAFSTSEIPTYPIICIQF